MIRLVRIVGFLLIASGALVLASYLIAPLRELWPWFLRLPMPIQIGLGIAALGFLILVGSVLWERMEDRETDRGLLDE